MHGLVGSYFVSSMAVLAERPALVRRLFVNSGVAGKVQVLASLLPLLCVCSTQLCAPDLLLLQAFTHTPLLARPLHA